MLRAFSRTLIGLLVAATAVLATDITGVWTGQQQGRRGEPEDIAFQFKVQGSALTGKDRKSTRLNSSHANISYAVFCLKKKKYEIIADENTSELHHANHSSAALCF